MITDHHDQCVKTELKMIWKDVFYLVLHLNISNNLSIIPLRGQVDNNKSILEDIYPVVGR